MGCKIKALARPGTGSRAFGPARFFFLKKDFFKQKMKGNEKRRNLSAQ
jgi:hypothetical protein